jgi:hypothetical protein
MTVLPWDYSVHVMQWAMQKKERWAAIETANFYFAFCYAEQFE